MADDECAALEDEMHNRNGRKVLKVYDGFQMAHMEKARPVVADRHGRFWRYDADDGQLVMIHDPNAASF